MENQKLGQEPAFAVPTNCNLKLDSNGNVVNSPEDGMSKRFYAACAAMQGIAAMHSTKSDIDNEWICKTAFNMADELLKQENL